MLGAVIDRAKEGILVTCLSQTFIPPIHLAEKFKDNSFRKPINKSNFQRFFRECSTENVAYYVNDSLHSKFIIIDNLLIYCTYNFTPTQFIFLDEVNIPAFNEMPEISYEGTHCEVSAHVVIENKDILQSFLEHVDSIKKNPQTIKVL